MNHRTPLGLALAAATLLGLSACGGDDAALAVNAPATTPTTFSGTAATGAAMANATVSISCVSGSGTATTAANGSYTTNIANVTLPCVLKAASSDGNTVLYSVTAAASTGAQVANITPLTQLLVASLAGTEPGTFFTNFSTTSSSLTASSVSAAQAAVLTTLRNAGLDVSTLSELLTGTLVAATSTSTGNAYDVVLDALKVQLTQSGTTLATLTTSVAAASPAVTTTTNAASSVASLPASLLLKTAASSCPALRSTDYFIAAPTPGGTLADQFDSFSLNAGTLATTNSDGSTSTLLASSDACHYTMSDLEMVVSPAGVILARTRENGLYRMRVAIPKQTIAVAELAGTWNALNFEKNNAGLYAGHLLTATIGSTGVFSDVSYCESASPAAICAAPSTTITVSSNSAGGFNLIGSGTDNWTDRAFAYRAGNGSLMLLSVSEDGSQTIWTKKRTLSLPTAATVFGKSWSIFANSSAIASSLNTSYTSTFTSSDAAANSYIRTVNLASGTPDYSETILINSPRDGYNFRDAGTATSTSTGLNVPIRKRTSLGLHGMGVSVQSVPTQTDITAERFQVTVEQP